MCSGKTLGGSSRVLAYIAACLLALSCLGFARSASVPRHGEMVALKTGRKAVPPVLPAADPVETRFIQLHPLSSHELTFQRSMGKTRAVVLIAGLHLHPFRAGEVNKAIFRSWEEPDSKLVEALAHHADVFAFAYSQNVAIEEIAGVPMLAEGIRRLKTLGYTDVVLVGHSAGGLVARQFVEDYPDAGVTKVIQVCTPNGGTNYAQLEPGVHKNQRIFLRSLTKEARDKSLMERPDKKIPATVQFVCVVGLGAALGDGVVSKNSQWPADLQAQGIPAVLLRTTHFTVMRAQADAQRIAELLREYSPRWNPAQIAGAKKELRAN
jgi:pimeloyl-ACP methyl ester carboxylesterase